MKNFQDMPLNRKLTVIIMLTTVAAILLASIAIVSYQLHTFSRFIISELETTADILGANGAVALRFNVPRDAESTLSTVQAKQHINGACFFTPTEELFAQYARDGMEIQMPEFPLTEGHTFAFTQNYIVLIKHIYQDSDRIGTVYLQSDLDVFYGQLLSSIVVTLLIIISCSTLALLLASKSLRVVAQPITNLVDVAVQVSENKDYTLRAQKFANDDLGILTDEFNDMLQQIQLRDADLQQTHARREQDIIEQVEKRTAELQEANEQLHREINERQQAQAASRTKSAFLANMSHEFRTPMSAIIGMTDLVLRGELKSDQRNYLEIVEDSAESLLLLLNDVLDFSKIEAGELVLEKALFSLSDTLNGTAKSLALKAHEKGLELTCRIAPEVPDQLIGDSTRLRQTIVNLVGNAIKFTEQGEASLAVTLEALDGTTAYLSFSVTDTGIGIPEDKRDLIFDAFSQADVSTTRQYGGTGLGLGISKQLVDIMGGHLAVESVVGEGSRFHFTVPFTFQQEANPIDELAATGVLKGKRVWVADDNATSRQILQEILLSWEVDAVCLDSGEALVKALTAADKIAPFEVVCLDMHMPGMDGAATAATIRQEFGPKGPRLIMLTSAGHANGTPPLEELAVDYCLDKPITRSHLYNTLSKAFGTAPQEDKTTQAEENTTATTRPLRILIAEDTVANQHLAKAVLEQNGHQVVIVDNGQKAVDEFSNASFDLVLMDAQMPVMDGFGATALIRTAEARSGKHTPIIALTARAMKGDRELCLQAGMDDYLSKPFRPSQLLEAIERCMRDLGAPLPLEARDTVPSFTKENVLDMLEGDMPLLARLTEFIHEGYPALLDELRQALAAGDAPQVEQKAHALKSTVGVVGENAAHEAAFQLEQAAGRGELERGREMLERCTLETERLLAALMEFTTTKA